MTMMTIGIVVSKKKALLEGAGPKVSMIMHDNVNRHTPFSTTRVFGKQLTQLRILAAGLRETEAVGNVIVLSVGDIVSALPMVTGFQS